MSRRLQLKKPNKDGVSKSFVDDLHDLIQKIMEQHAPKLLSAYRRVIAVAVETNLTADKRTMEQIQQVLHFSQERLNWNFFVGDHRLKTDFFLRFSSPITARYYEHWMVSGSLYSMRFWLLTLYITLAMTQTVSATTQLFYFLALVAGLMATIECRWPLLHRQLVLNLLSFLALLRLLQISQSPDASTMVNLVCRISLLCPALLTNLLVLENWMKFFQFSVGQLIAASLIKSTTLWMFSESDSDFSTYTLLSSMVYITIGFTFIFALFEKVSKERFVINQSNQQSRKLFGELINACCSSCLVSPEGKISFFNEAFRSLVIERLEFDALPSNIFDIFGDQEQEKEQLQNMLQVVCEQIRGPRDAMFRNIIEVRIPRHRQPEANQQSSQNANQVPDLFEMVRISCQLSQFSGNKCVVLSIECINDYEGHAKLIVQLAHSLQGFLSSFQEAVENAVVQQSPNDNRVKREARHENRYYSDTFRLLVNSTEKPHQLLYCLNQVQFQVKLMSIMSVAQTLWQGHRTESDFLFAENVKNCLEMCSNMLTHHAELSYTHDDGLPEVIKGDFDILKLALQTLTEFALKYSAHDESIITRTNFDAIMDDDTYQVSFNINMSMNKAYDNEKIFRLLNVNNSFGEGDGYNDDIHTFLLQRAIAFQEYIEKFGVGLLILPCLVHLLDGRIHAKADSRRVNRRRTLTQKSARQDTNDKSQSISVILQVPLCTPDKESKQGHIPPVLVSGDRSNRRDDGVTTTWVAPDHVREQSRRGLQKRNKLAMIAQYGSNELDEDGLDEEQSVCSDEDKSNGSGDNSVSEIQSLPMSMPQSEDSARWSIATPSVARLVNKSNNGNPARSEAHPSPKIPIQNNPFRQHVNFLNLKDDPNQSQKFDKNQQPQPLYLPRQVTVNSVKTPKMLPSSKRSSSVGFFNEPDSHNNFNGVELKQSRGQERLSHSPVTESQGSDMSREGKVSNSGIQQGISMAMIPAASDNEVNMFPSDQPRRYSGKNLVSVKMNSSSDSMGFESAEFRDPPNGGSGQSMNFKNDEQKEDYLSVPKQMQSLQPDSSLLSKSLNCVIPSVHNSDQRSVSLSKSSEIKLDSIVSASPPANVITEQKGESRVGSFRINCHQNQSSNKQQVEQVEEQKNIVEEQKEGVEAQPVMIVTGGNQQQPPFDSENANKLPMLAAIDEKMEMSDGSNADISQLSGQDGNEVGRVLSSSMPSLFIDEVAGGRDLKHILADLSLKDKIPKRIEQAQPGQDEQWQDDLDSDDSDDEPVLTEEQKKDLRERKERLLQDYFKKLSKMREEEVKRQNEIMSQRAEQEGVKLHDRSSVKLKGPTPLVMMRLDDHLNSISKLQEQGASSSLMAERNSGREHLRQNNPPLLSARGKRDRKIEADKFMTEQKVREVQRRIYEQTAIIQSKKENHEIVKPSLVEIVPSEIISSNIQTFSEASVSQVEDSEMPIDLFAPEEINMLRKFGQLDLNNVALPEEQRITLRNVQKVLARLQAKRKRSCKTIMDAKSNPTNILSLQKALAANGNVSEGANDNCEDGSMVRQIPDSSGNTDRSNSISNSNQEEEKHNIRMNQKANDSQENKSSNLSMSGSGKKFSQKSSTDTFDVMMRNKKQSNLESLKNNSMYPIEEEKSCLHNSFSDEGNANIQNKSSQKSGSVRNLENSKNKGTIPIRIENRRSNNSSSNVMIQMVSPKQVGPKSSASSSNNGDATPVELNSDNDESLSQNSNLSPGQLGFMKQKPSFRGPGSPESLPVAESKEISVMLSYDSIAVQPSAEDMRVSMKPRRPFQNRGLLKDKFQKVPAVKDQTLMSRMAKHDVENRDKRTAWRVADVNHRKALRRMCKPKRRRPGDEEEDECSTPQRGGDSSSSIEDIYCNQ